MGVSFLTEPDESELRALVARALAEDVGSGDVTAAATVPAANHRMTFRAGIQLRSVAISATVNATRTAIGL